MNNEKRVVKGYKIKPSVYKKAMKRAGKEKGHLSNLVECVVIAYAEGLSIKAVSIKSGEATVSDILDLISKRV